MDSDKELIMEIMIPNYIRTVVLSKSRQAKYYIRGKREPKTKKALACLDNGKYIWIEHKMGKKMEFRLFDVVTREYVIKNTQTAGTPKIKIINGQDIYAGTNEFVKNSMMRQIKTFFIPFIHGLKPIPLDKCPIRVLSELHDTISDEEQGNYQRWDVDNRMYPYNKGFMDVLSKYYESKKTGNFLPFLNKGVDESDYIIHRMIPDDDRLHVTQPPTALFCPVDTTAESKLVFKIYHDKRPIVQKIKDFQERNAKKPLTLSFK